MSKKLIATLDETLSRARLVLREQPEPLFHVFTLFDTAYSIVGDVQRKILLAKDGCECLADIATHNSATEIAVLADTIVQELSPSVARCLPLL